ncbi:hypothetical protein K469DRAFT_697589 [Zopfia rhizophila CBS 207.26]|uniref:Uncharacterized protein n=1 Tax=Zopfia rhizophila CBS 207.26 TaxID=1314779 RepID=A0A6A6DBW9_9PEZI|nr:hypothetical protein K469DRAFT_697589 [Zopfia rhizophila CBS 207.26]
MAQGATAMEDGAFLGKVLREVVMGRLTPAQAIDIYEKADIALNGHIWYLLEGAAAIARDGAMKAESDDEQSIRTPNLCNRVAQCPSASFSRIVIFPSNSACMPSHSGGTSSIFSFVIYLVAIRVGASGLNRNASHLVIGRDEQPRYPEKVENLSAEECELRKVAAMELGLKELSYCLSLVSILWMVGTNYLNELDRLYIVPDQPLWPNMGGGRDIQISRWGSSYAQGIQLLPEYFISSLAPRTAIEPHLTRCCRLPLSKSPCMYLDLTLPSIADDFAPRHTQGLFAF